MNVDVNMSEAHEPLFDKLKSFVKPLPECDLGRRYSAEELNGDLDFMIRTMEDVHPNLYFSRNREDAAEEIEAIRNGMKEGLTRLEFYRLMAGLAADFRDGHTLVHTPSEEYHDYKTKGGFLFPFDVDCSSGRVVLVKSHRVEDAPVRGSILSINGMPIDDIMGRMTSLYGYEHEEMRLSVLSRKFGALLYILHGGTDHYEIELDDGGHRSVHLTLGAPAEKPESAPRAAPVREPEPYGYGIFMESGHAVLDFRAFVDPGRFRALLSRMFREIDSCGVRKLIVDLRNNSGGNSMLTDEFVSRITDKPYRQYARIELKVSRQIREYYQVIMKCIPPYPIRLLPARLTFPAPWKRGIGETVIQEVRPGKPGFRSPRFSGSIIVLTGPFTFSSATGFAAVIQDHSLGVVAGLPTGGNATSYGDGYPFSLPATCLECGVSHKMFIRPDGNEIPEPVVPDYYFEEQMRDGEQDSLMEYAIGLDIEDR
jgi:hypothetical protein